jgi:hypothetical protein
MDCGTQSRRDIIFRLQKTLILMDTSLHRVSPLKIDLSAIHPGDHEQTVAIYSSLRHTII